MNGMRTIVVDWLIRVMSLSWLTGPIFDKELRVSSRRRRNYVLRFAYIVFFAMLTALVWTEAVPRGSTSVLRASRMAQAGQAIVTFVVWFQFIGAQIVAIVMLSTAISDEIYNKTLGLLMTTPVGSLQIVLGKLLSKLLQLLLLLTITLPLLGIVRVFGGVSWDYLLTGLSVTITTAVFLGTLSLLFSIFTRRAHTVIIVTVLVAGVLFLLVPILFMFMLHERFPGQVIMDGLSYVNPYILLVEATGNSFAVRGLGQVNWLAHCGISLGASALLLLLATVFVRKVALRQATGQEVIGSGRRRAPRRGIAIRTRVRRVVGPCVLWKERRTPLWGRLNTIKIVAALLALGLLLLTYILCAGENALDDDETQITYILVFTALGLLFTMVLPATCITSEKESRAWPILLTTTVTNGQILLGKFLGSVRRCIAVWLLLCAHVVVFVLAGIFHPVAILQLGIVVAWIVTFLCASGLYFGTRFRRTTGAVIANVTLAIALWAIVPLLWALAFAIARGNSELLECYLDMNPFVQAGVVAMGTVGHDGLGYYDWAQGGMRDMTSATIWILCTFLVYCGASLLFLWRAWARLRRHPV